MSDFTHFNEQGRARMVDVGEKPISQRVAVAGARVLVQEPDVVTTVLAGRVGWLKLHPQEAATIIRAHRELTQWIIEHPEEARARVVDELTQLTQAPMEPELGRSAWKRLKLTDEQFEQIAHKTAERILKLTDAIDLPGLEQFVKDAQATGLLDRVPPLEGMIYKQD